ncbi:MAG: flavin-dependent reductase [Propionibacteriaceae bacterium]|jgi:flavin reductase (DIM6/NTAB) family NADH-FMN oxidoreductase RutF|nr:flavin-dependent reductase [Propionibacteriaceae bacterium]
MTSVSEDPEDLVQAERFKQIMRQHASGVTVITTQADGPVGFCATSLASLSLYPPMVSFAVAAASRSGRAWMSATHGMVHLLHVGQTSLARRFALADSDKFGNRTSWHWGPLHLPVLDDVLAIMLVQVATRVRVGDHLLVIAEILTGEVSGEEAPLVYHDGNFASPTLILPDNRLGLVGVPK